MKKIILFSICASVLYSSNAAADMHNSLSDSTKIYSDTSKLSLGVSLGTMGVGVEGKLLLFRHFHLRTGATIFPIGISRTYLGFPSRAVNAKIDGTIAKVDLYTDWAPFTEADANILQKFSLTAGLGYFISAKGTAVMRLKDPFYYGDIELEPEDVGELRAASKWDGFAPYIGIGINNLKVTDRVNLGISSGVFYLTSPSVQITGSNMLSGNSNNQEQFRKNMAKYFRWLPVLQFSFNYNIK